VFRCLSKEKDADFDKKRTDVSPGFCGEALGGRADVSLGVNVVEGISFRSVSNYNVSVRLTQSAYGKFNLRN